MPSPNTGAFAAQSAITVGTSATRLVAVRINRRSVMVQNLDAAAIFVGSSTVTTSGATAGISVAANATVTFDTSSGELWAISAAGTGANTVHVLELYG